MATPAAPSTSLVTPEIPTPTPPKPATTNVTFDSPEDSSTNLPIPRMSSGVNILYGAAQSVTASARTSYTRVDVPPPDTQDDEQPEQAEQTQEVPRTPQVALTFLLVTSRRQTMSFEPTLAVQRVKDLVWNTWPAEFQNERPPAPSFLRILHRGRVLQDDDVLKDIPFPIDAPPTIVHMSIRPGALADDVSKTDNDQASCCCIIS